MTGNISPEACSPTVSMWVARADWAAGARVGRGSMRREHTTSLARCESARGSPGGASGSCWPAHRLAATSRFLTTAADLSVPFARVVVIGRARGFDGHTQWVRLSVPVKTAPSSDQTRARQRYRAFSHYVAAAFIGAFFPPDPLMPPRHVSCSWEDRLLIVTKHVILLLRAV